MIKQLSIFALVALIAVSGMAFENENNDDDKAKAAAKADTPATAAPATPASAPAATPALPYGAPTKLLVFPSEINLNNARDRQSVVAQAVYANGLTEDVTSRIQWKVENEALLKRDQNRLFPIADGETKISVTLDNLSVDVPVKVAKAVERPPISFHNDVMPVFSKAGCNAGSCHGAARGKDGFRLSLYGFDPKGDYHRLTREISGRRINVSTPDDCLLMTKATGNVPHSGGKLFDPDSEYYVALKNWLENGAAIESGDIPTVESVELYPQGGVLNGPNVTQQMTVRAKYSDGTDRDVTSLAYFSTNNDNSASVSQNGVVTANNRGEAFVMARFDTHTVGVDFIVLPKDVQFNWAEVKENNYIDTLINEKLRKLRIQPSELCSDAEFIRRVSLDIAGIVPTLEEVNSFVEDADPAKREKYVDQLLARKEFVEMWVMKWSELLQIRSTQIVSYKATLLYYNWLQQRIADNMPIDQMVRELLSSQGGTFTNPATNYYQAEQDNLKVAENVAQVFMGMRIQCTQCHNHPFDRWTMDDYYSFAAFFSQIGRKPSEDPRETVVYNRGGGEVKHPVGGRVMAPKFLGGATPDVKGKDRRAVMAEWMTAADNPYFAKNLSNIVWAHFFGRGIVNEVDDVRVSNPAVNPQLLDAMGKKFVEYKYDFKKIVRDICTSRTYQLSTKTNETNAGDLTNFSHASLRRIRAEVLLDVISQITETKNKFRGLPLGSRAVQIADGNTSTYFLTTFGRAKRESVCSCEVKMEPNLSQALHLINGDSVHKKIQQGGVITRLLNEQKKSSDEIIKEIYMRCLARQPKPEELERINEQLATIEDKKQGLEDVFWAVLNSREFVFNH